MTFDTNRLNNFCGMLQIPLPRECENEAQKLCEALQKGKKIKVTLEVKRKSRSLNANALLWKALQDLAEYYNTSKWELYKKYIIEYGQFEYMAVLKDALPKLNGVFRAIIERGKVTTAEGVELVRVQCFWGSSTYDTKAFSFLLDKVLEDAKKVGFDYISDADKALLMEEYERERQKAAAEQ